MISGALSRRARELSDGGSPFVVATVVRVQHPASVRPGDGAVVLADGTIEGFVGGVCAQHSVRLYSLQAIETGQPLLLRILPEPGPAAGEEDDPIEAEDPERTEEIAREDGTVTVQNPCLSAGAIEVFLEPALPAPRVLLAGDSPIIGALRRIGSEVGLAMVDAAGSAGPGAMGGATGTGPMPEPGPMPGDLAVVVAAHGRDELGALRAGLEAGVPYVGLVASRKRGAAVLDQLREDGLGEEQVTRVDTPAGLDISARTASEIALSIIARIVEVRRTQAAPQPIAARPNTAVDPICGMTVVVGADTPSLERGGQTVYFCCLGCKLKFEEQSADTAVAG